MHFFFPHNNHSGTVANAVIFSWLIQLIGLMVCFPDFNILNKLNEFQLPLLRFSARQYKGFNSRAMRFSVESAGEGPGPGRLTDQNP